MPDEDKKWLFSFRFENSSRAHTIYGLESSSVHAFLLYQIPKVALNVADNSFPDTKPNTRIQRTNIFYGPVSWNIII